MTEKRRFIDVWLVESNTVYKEVPFAVVTDWVQQGRVLENDKSPSRKVGGIDNRGSHFYLAMYWAAELGAQKKDAELARIFQPIAAELAAQESTIVAELIAVQGKPVDVGGYYQPDPKKASAAMRPSATFNAILAKL